MKKYLFFLIVTTTFCLFSCKDEEATKVAILINSGDIKQFAAAGNKIIYELEVYSLKSTLKQLNIVSADNEYGAKTLLDTVPDVSKFFYTFVYDVPPFAKDSALVTLSMRAIDYDNNSYQLKCYITVTGGAQILPELSGIVMYSAKSGMPNAFSLDNPTQIFLQSLADSAKVDVYDFNSQTSSTDLSREWRTNTSVMFSKANNFNYATATLISIKNTFNESIRDKYVSNIAPNDIILLSKNNNVYGVIQITDIADNDGTANDYYRFNIKIAKTQ